MIELEPFPGSPDDMMNTVAALRAQVAELEAALIDWDRGEYDGQNGTSAFFNRLRAALKDALRDASERVRAPETWESRLRAAANRPDGVFFTVLADDVRAVIPELDALRERVARLEAALKNIGKQMINAEMNAIQHIYADYAGAYETMIKVARAALKDAPQ